MWCEAENQYYEVGHFPKTQHPGVFYNSSTTSDKIRCGLSNLSGYIEISPCLAPVI